MLRKLAQKDCAPDWALPASRPCPQEDSRPSVLGQERPCGVGGWLSSWSRPHVGSSQGFCIGGDWGGNAHGHGGDAPPPAEGGAVLSSFVCPSIHPSTQLMFSGCLLAQQGVHGLGVRGPSSHFGGSGEALALG